MRDAGASCIHKKNTVPLGSSPLQKKAQDRGRKGTPMPTTPVNTGNQQGLQRKQQTPESRSPLYKWKFYRNPFYQRFAATARGTVASNAAPENRDQEEATLPASSRKISDRKSSVFPLFEVQTTNPIDNDLQVAFHQAYDRVRELETMQKLAKKEIQMIRARCANEQENLKGELQEKIRALVLPITEELEKERKARVQLTSENRRLSVLLSKTSKAVEESETELEKERKSRQQMEGVYHELAKELKQAKSKLEALMRDHDCAESELEEERAMLQMADALREERVQMKLQDAQLEIEQRCMALDELKRKLACMLNAGKERLGSIVGSSCAHRLICDVDEAQAYARAPVCLPERNTDRILHPFAFGNPDQFSSDDCVHVKIYPFDDPEISIDAVQGKDGLTANLQTEGDNNDRRTSREFSAKVASEHQAANLKHARKTHRRVSSAELGKAMEAKPVKGALEGLRHGEGGISTDNNSSWRRGRRNENVHASVALKHANKTHSLSRCSS